MMDNIHVPTYQSNISVNPPLQWHAQTNKHLLSGKNTYIYSKWIVYLHDSGLPIEKGSCFAGRAFRCVSNKRHKSTFILQLGIMHLVLEPPA